MEAAITAGIEAMASTTETVFATNLPTIMVVFGGLVALGVILRIVKRVIGRKA